MLVAPVTSEDQLLEGSKRSLELELQALVWWSQPMLGIWWGLQKWVHLLVLWSGQGSEYYQHHTHWGPEKPLQAECKSCQGC